jgi:predicted RNA methylase
MKNILCVVLVLMLSACATMESVNLNYSQIDYSDGISKKEAKTIVRKMYIDGDIPEDIRKNVKLSLTVATYEKDIDTWLVTLSNGSLNVFRMYSYVVYVDAKTGEIKGQRLQNENTPLYIPIPI